MVEVQRVKQERKLFPLASSIKSRDKCLERPQSRKEGAKMCPRCAANPNFCSYAQMLKHSGIAPTLAPCLGCSRSLSCHFFLTHCVPFLNDFASCCGSQIAQKRLLGLSCPFFISPTNYKQHEHIRMAKQNALSLSIVPMDRTHVGSEVVQYFSRRNLHCEDAIFFVPLLFNIL